MIPFRGTLWTKIYLCLEYTLCIISLVSLVSLVGYFSVKEINFRKVSNVSDGDKSEHYWSQTTTILSCFAPIGVMGFMCKRRNNRNRYQSANDEQMEGLNTFTKGLVETQQRQVSNTLLAIEERQALRHEAMMDALAANNETLAANNEGMMTILSTIATSLQERNARRWI